jgi:hypothetical protein
MLLGIPFFIIVGALYIFFAFVEPPEAIAHFFRVPVIAIFFPPEKRMKLGRLTFGALLVFMGPLLALIPAGGLARRSPILGAILAILVLGIWLAAKWKRAGELSDAGDAECRVQWESFELLKRDPRFLHLQQYLYAKGYRTTFERVSDPVTYRVRYVTLQDDRYQRVLAQHNPPARWVVAYLERDAEPKRIQATLDLQTGVCTDMAAGWLGWSGLIPLQPSA